MNNPELFASYDHQISLFYHHFNVDDVIIRGIDIIHFSDDISEYILDSSWDGLDYDTEDDDFNNDFPTDIVLTCYPDQHSSSAPYQNKHNCINSNILIISL
eukprot:7198321-Ditylum_brightwellii.AAC.1